MADTQYPVNHPLARKHWGDGLMKEALKRTWALKFISSNDKNALCYVKTETQKSGGDKVTVGLRAQLEGDGVVGDDTLEGNEESLETANDSVVIDQLRHAVRSSGKMSEQRVPFTVRDEAKDGLADWWADRLDDWFFRHLCGDTVSTDNRYIGHNATVAPSTNIIYDDSSDSSHTAEGSLSESDVFKLKLIDWSVEQAKTRTLPLRPIRINGNDYYVMFLHPYQVTSLRTDTATLGWGDIQKAAMQGGQVTKNPIFTGALGVYNGVILHESTRIRQGINSGAYLGNTRRAVLCGAQSLCMAFGKGHSPGKFDWNEELFDYGNKLGVEAGCISGLKKSRYTIDGTAYDHGVITVSTFAKSKV